MWKLVKTSIAIICLFSVGYVQSDVNEVLINICNIVKADDKGELRKKMKRVETDFNLKLKDYYPAISCDGNSLIRTAMLNNAIKTGTLMVKKMSKSDLSAPEQDGKTVITWASENGLDSSPIVAVLKGRI
jgi:hypothetical protein